MSYRIQLAVSALDSATTNLTDIGTKLLPGNPGINATFPEKLASILNNIFGILGIIAFILILYAGFLYLNSRGDEKTTQKAKDMMTYAIIGLAVIFVSYTLTAFIFTQLAAIPVSN